MPYTLPYTPVYPMTRRSRPKIRGRMMPESDGISQARTVGQNQDLKQYDVRFVLLNNDADVLDRFFRDRDARGEWFYWTPPQVGVRTIRCRQWNRSLQNGKWSLLNATFDEVLVPLAVDICICPSLLGSSQVGSVITIDTITCGTGTGTITSVQWKADGVNISGATSTTYTAALSELDKAVTAFVTYLTPTGESQSCTTNAITITAPPDLYFSNVVLLLPLATNFTDYSNLNHVISTTGNVNINTSIYKFESGSAFFDGTNDYLSAPDSEAWNFGSGDFTIETFFRPSVNNDILNIVNQKSTNTSQFAFDLLWVPANSTIRFRYSTTGTSFTEQSFAFTLVSNTWYHLALTRSGTSLRCFKDGTQAGSTVNIGTTAFFNSTATLKIGGNSFTTSDSLTGYMNEFRITKGVARYTANFTPPVQRFPTS